MAPNQYAIGVAKNKFALCEDSEEELDPHELLKKQQKEKEEKKKAKEVEKNTAKPVKSGKSTGQATRPASNFKQGEATRPKSLPPAVKRNVNFSDRNQTVPKQDREESDRNLERDAGDHADYRADGSSGSESGAPARGERRGFSRVFVRGGGRGGRGGFDGRKREFDRRSGSDKTGVKAVDKRRSSGSFNWGTPEDEILSAEVPQEEPKSPEGSQTAEQSDKLETTEAAKEEDGQVVSTEEEKPALTLDEWKALKSSRPKPNYNIRKPGEGEDLTRWKDMVVLSKKETDEEEDEEYEYGEYPQRVGRQKRLEIDVRFYDRRGRGRGGRGAARGPLPAAPGGTVSGPRPPVSGPRPAVREQRPAAPAPRVDDEADFPSLV